MAQTKRYYLVRAGDKLRLVRATNKVQARNHVARETISVELATQDDLIGVARELKPENAVEEPPTDDGERG